MSPSSLVRNRSLVASSALACSFFVALACSDAPESDPGALPGGANKGGANMGGSAQTGGSTLTGTGGFKAGTGGTFATGGSTATGGAKSTAGGGATGSGGSVGTGGSSGGRPSSTTGGNGASTGGKANGTGGMPATGGAPSATGGTPNASGGAAGGGGGTPSAGGAGAGSGGAPSGGDAPRPSAGCGKAPGQTGSAGSPLNVANHQYYFKLPMTYDNSKPYPLLYVFHPSGNDIDWAEKNAGFEATPARQNAIIVYPKSAGNGWEQVDIALFDPLHKQLTDNYCVDLARVFATGESSGGDYASVLGCEKADKVRAVGPTAAKPMSGVGLNPSTRTCTGKTTAYVIHGKADSVVGAQAGIQTRDFHLAKNNCGTMTTPVAGYTDNLSNCVQYQGCDEGYPVFWCQHEDPEYYQRDPMTGIQVGTNHGWPKFAGKFLWEQFSKF